MTRGVSWDAVAALMAEFTPAERLAFTDSDMRPALKRALTVRRLATVGKSAFPITVNYEKSLAEMIAVAKFDNVDERIDVRDFPLLGKGIVKRECRLVEFHDENVSIATASLFLLLNGFRQAAIEDIIAFGVCHYHGDVHRHMVHAFGAVTRPMNHFDDRMYACLDHCLQGKSVPRTLLLDSREYVYTDVNTGYFQTLAVRDIAKQPE